MILHLTPLNLSSRKDFLPMRALIHCLLYFSFSCCIFGQSDEPNFLFVLADDCTYLDLEVYGGQAKTPNLNKLASEGMTFNRCYEAASMCSPTRHNLYTGIYPIHSGSYPNHTFANPGAKSIVHHLKTAGYRVALLGKTHIEPKSVFPFEYLEGMEYGYDDNQKTPEGSAVIRNPNLKRFIEECTESGTPFCVFAASYDPHGPYTRGESSVYNPSELSLPPNILDTPNHRENYSKYLAECTFFDSQVGECLSYLREFEVENSTLVLVATEQGSSFPFGKWNNYETSVHSGLIARWPGKIAAGSQSDAIVEYGDVVPTLVEAAGARLVSEIDGKSFLDILTGKATNHKTYAYASQTFIGVNGNKEPYGMRTIVNRNYRYIRNLKPSVPITYSQTGGFTPKLKPESSGWRGEIVRMAQSGDQSAKDYINKMVYRPAEELYDINADPFCLDNLIDREELSGVKNELSLGLDRWMGDQGDLGWETELNGSERTKKTSKLWRDIREAEALR